MKEVYPYICKRKGFQELGRAARKCRAWSEKTSLSTFFFFFRVENIYFIMLQAHLQDGPYVHANTTA